MKLVENYNGATLTFQYDRNTRTYLGFLEGLSVETSVQATSYDELIEAFHEAVDTYIEERFALKRFEVKYEREAAVQRAAEGDTLKVFADDDPYSRRQFLR